MNVCHLKIAYLRQGRCCDDYRSQLRRREEHAKKCGWLEDDRQSVRWCCLDVVQRLPLLRRHPSKREHFVGPLAFLQRPCQYSEYLSPSRRSACPSIDQSATPKHQFSYVLSVIRKIFLCCWWESKNIFNWKIWKYIYLWWIIGLENKSKFKQFVN